MLVNPYIYNSDGTKNYVAPRELRKTSDNFGIVRYKKKLFFVQNDFFILQDYETPSQTDYHFSNEPIANFKFKESVEQNKILSLIVPNERGLFELAAMGVDAAVICLRVKARNNQQTAQIYNQSLRLRTRYTQLDQMTFSEANNFYLRHLSLNPLVEHLKSRYLVHPFNSARFISELRQANAFTVNDYLTKQFGSIGFTLPTRQNSIENHLFKNIFFHNCIMMEEPQRPTEYDLLEYNEIESSNSNNSESKFQLSNELLNHILRWERTTKNKLQRLAQEVVISMQSDPKLRSVYDLETIASNALNLSAFTALAFSEDPSITKRINIMFGRGVRKIGHLIELP